METGSTGLKNIYKLKHQKKMKKSYLFTLSLSFCMSLFLSGCGEKKKNVDEAINNSPTEQESTLEAKNWAEKLLPRTN